MSDDYYIDGTIDNLDSILADPENHGKMSIGATELRMLLLQFKSIRAENERLREALSEAAEKHARIAEEAGATMDEYVCVLCGDIADTIRAAKAALGE